MRIERRGEREREREGERERGRERTDVIIVGIVVVLNVGMVQACQSLHFECSLLYLTLSQCQCVCRG